MILIWIAAVTPLFALILWAAQPGRRRHVPPWLQIAAFAWMVFLFALRPWLL